MLIEQRGKAGGLCDAAKAGTIRCPLIVRPTSEDVVTDHVVSTLRTLNPRWWLPDLLNRGLGTPRFRRQLFRKLRIEPWQKQPSFPRHLIEWDEGQTEVDIVITWENPATTVFVEMKYGSGLSPTTVNNAGDQSYPADQLIRNARVGLYRCGWYDEPKLFSQPKRDFALLLLTPTSGNPLVAKYRDPATLRSSIPHGETLLTLPDGPFIGELSYRDFVLILDDNRPRFSTPERSLVDQLTEYITFKTTQLQERNGKGH
ncbi:MAG TPA: hypothetical protein VGN57_14470 [Pirellulaceae bacterium]|jgi:hypothetical protein|nr:hypothetical protein [Pirellulaceae bacterium]